MSCVALPFFCKWGIVFSGWADAKFTARIRIAAGKKPENR
jgi:hypothetical protein